MQTCFYQWEGRISMYYKCTWIVDQVSVEEGYSAGFMTNEALLSYEAPYLGHEGAW